MSDVKFRAMVRHDGSEVGDLPWLEEFWAVRYEDYTALQARLAKVEEERDAADSRARAAFADAASNHIRFAEATNRIEELEDALKLNQDLDAISVAAVNELTDHAELIELLTEELRYWQADSAAAWDKCEKYRLKLADPRVKLLETRNKEAVETLRVGFKSCDQTKTAAAIILAIAQLEGHGE
jgi:hypothetical protein